MEPIASNTRMGIAINMHLAEDVTGSRVRSIEAVLTVDWLRTHPWRLGRCARVRDGGDAPRCVSAWR